MEFTGERVIPGQVETDLWNEHLARYAFAARLAADRAPGPPLRILDAGCGSGYGSSLLAASCPQASVTGLDVSGEAIEYAQSHYAAPNLAFHMGDCLSLDPALGRFDLAICFEVIEHLERGEDFLRAVREALTPGGWLVISTPNRRYYTDEREYTNPFHAREFDTAEFDALLGESFPHRVMFTQNHAPAVCFAPVAGECGPAPGSGLEAGGVMAASETEADQPHFLVAICALQPVAPLPAFVYVPSAANLLREREQHIAKLEAGVARLHGELEERDATIRQLQAEYERDLTEARAVLEQRERQLEERLQWARQLEQECERLGGLISGLQEEINGLHADVEAKVEWARSLEEDVAQAREALAKLQQEFGERTQWALSLDAERTRLQEALFAINRTLWYRAGRGLRLCPPPPWAAKRGAE